MKVEEDIKNGSCKVQYCSTHCGHKKELAHMHIPESLKFKIASQHDNVPKKKDIHVAKKRHLKAELVCIYNAMATFTVY